MVSTPDQVQRAEASGPLVVCTTQAAADFVAATLAANGLSAWTQWTYAVYPSLGWVEGYRVTVDADQEEAARDLLQALERDDVLPVPSEDDASGS